MAEEDGYMLSKEFVERTADAVRIVEAMPGGAPARRGNAIPRGVNLQPIRVTSTTTVEDRYPGKLLIFDVSDNSFTEATDIWIVPGDGQELVEGDYDGYARGRAGTTSRMVFKTVGAAEMIQVSILDDVSLIRGDFEIDEGTWT